MNVFGKALLTVFAGIAISSSAYASGNNSGSNAQGDVTVKIQKSISVAQTQILDFGTVVPDHDAPGSVTIPTSGAAIVNNVTNTVPGAPGTFTVTGDSNASYSVALLDSSITLTSASSTDTMGAELKLSNGTTTEVRTLSNGTDNFNVGGTLNIGANQETGVYSGTYNVNVNYQ